MHVKLYKQVFLKLLLYTKELKREGHYDDMDFIQRLDLKFLGYLGIIFLFK